MRDLHLPILMTALVAACAGPSGNNDDDSDDTGGDSGWCYGTNPQPSEMRQTYTVAAADFEAALGGADTLSAAACEQLCRDAHWFPELVLEVRECRDDGVDGNGDELIFCRYLEDAYCEGRAHAAVRRQTESAGPDATAAWLARAAHAEASSVGAFLALASELRRHGATELVERARDAARDEVVHARWIGALAARAGGRRQPLAFHDVPDRDLEALATENAVEGCVGETWAALQAAWQAQHAPTPELRSVFAHIARDEADHATLAADLHAWALARLDAEASARVEQARLQALSDLIHVVDDAAAPGLGLPEHDMAVRLARGLREALA